MPTTCDASATDTLAVLRRTLNRQANELLAIDCGDATAADAIRFAVDQIAAALRHTQRVQRTLETTETPACRNSAN